MQENTHHRCTNIYIVYYFLNHYANMSENVGCTWSAASTASLLPAKVDLRPAKNAITLLYDLSAYPHKHATVAPFLDFWYSLFLEPDELEIKAKMVG